MKTQEQIAREAEINPAHLSRILSGKRRASLAVAEKLAAITGKSIFYFLDSTRYDESGQRRQQAQEAPTHG